MSKYDINAIRGKLKSKTSTRFRDPNEFRPMQPQEGETFKYRFYVLPPLNAGDKCVEGVASRSMELFYVTNGSHWINNKPLSCPRVHDEEECPLCAMAFEFMTDAGDDKKARSTIAKTYLPRTQYAMNIYMLNSDVNPPETRGKVMWYNPSKQVYDIMEKCLYNDNPGDPADPQACGVFYDEEAAYVFQLETMKDEGGYVSYKTSKFLANTGMRPVAAKKDASGAIVPAREKIDEILAQRFDLFTKFEARDHAKLEEVVRRVKNQDTSDDAGFAEDEAAPVQAKKPVAPKATVRPTTVLSDDMVDEGPVEVKPAKPAAKKPVVEDLEVENIEKPVAPAAKPKVADSDDVSEEELEQLLGDLD